VYVFVLDFVKVWYFGIAGKDFKQAEKRIGQKTS
jgi:hypothetical protein